VRACVFLRRRFWMTLTLTLTLVWTLPRTLILTTLSLALRNLSLTWTSRTLSVRMCAAETWWGVLGDGCVVYKERVRVVLTRQLRGQTMAGRGRSG
jgi:hypothetical protein